MRFLYLHIILLSLFLPVTSFGQVAMVEKHSICSFNKKVYRTIRLEDYGDLGCETVYTKKGSDERVGGGIHKASCSRIFNNIVSNLENAQWQCSEATGSAFTIETASSR